MALEMMWNEDEANNTSNMFNRISLSLQSIENSLDGIDSKASRIGITLNTSKIKNDINASRDKIRDMMTKIIEKIVELTSVEEKNINLLYKILMEMGTEIREDIGADVYLKAISYFDEFSRPTSDEELTPEMLVAYWKLFPNYKPQSIEFQELYWSKFPEKKPSDATSADMYIAKLIIEKKIARYYQDIDAYSNISYGNKNFYTNGCGICAICNLASDLGNSYITPEWMARYFNKGTSGGGTDGTLGGVIDGMLNFLRNGSYKTWLSRRITD